jgi:hypothetical protein
VTQPFIYSGSLRALELVGAQRDVALGRTLVQHGTVKDPTAVHALRYRITVNQEEVSSFTVWIEKRAPSSANPAAPTLPAAFEFRPRSFLRLRVVRTA